MQATAASKTIEPRPAAALVFAALTALFIASALYTIEPKQAHEQYFTICFFKSFTNLPCPFCGLTHSFCAIGKGDFVGGFEFNLLGPPLFALLIMVWIRSLCALLDKKKLVIALDETARRLRLARAFAIAFALFGAARIVYVLLFHGRQ